MNRRSLMQAVAAMIAPVLPALPARAKRRPDWMWGREVVVGERACSFVVLPLLDYGTADRLVVTLSITHIFYGDTKTCNARLAELEAYHVNRPARLLTDMGEREISYQNNPYGARRA